MVCNDMTTARYFSERSGDATVGVSSIRKSLQTLLVTDYVPEYARSDSVGKRKLLFPDEILRFSLSEALVIIRGQKVYRVKKFDYTKNPESLKFKAVKAADHVPQWGMKEREKEEREETGGKAKAENGAGKEAAGGKKTMGGLLKLEDLF